MGADQCRYLARRMATDPEFAEKKRKMIREINRARYATDPDFREYQKAYHKARYAKRKELQVAATVQVKLSPQHVQ